MPVVLIGFMGSGKSRVGRELARLLSRPFVDLDARIEEAAGKPIPELFQQEGEAAFRALETRSLRRALEENAVLSTGGGVVTQEGNRRLLHESKAPVVWLQASPQVLARRIRSEPGARPLIDGGGLLDLEQTAERVRALLHEREPLYRQCATVEVATDGRSVEEIAADIAQVLGEKQAA